MQDDTEWIRGLINPKLEWEDVWAYSPPILEMWAAWKHRTLSKGKLRHLLIRSDTDGAEKALAVSVGFEPNSESSASGLKETRQDTAGGWLHFLPSFVLSENMLVTSLIAQPQPWFAPSLAGFVAYPERDPDDKQWHFTYEHPLQISSPSNKIDNEQHHLERFCTDYLLWYGSSPYETIARGDDPPDFLCTSEAELRGTECTQLPVTERRQAFALFKAVKLAILEATTQSRSRFAAITGLAIYLRFEGATEQTDFPPPTANKMAALEIAEKLAEFRPNLDAFINETDGFPEQAPPLSFGETSFGCTFHAAPLLNAYPNSSFFMAVGFELGFGFHTIHRPSDVWEQIL